MEIKITPNTKGSKSCTVEDKDTALSIGSGLAKVYATPAMIAFMEETAYKSIQDQLPEGFSSVGIEINVKHIKATLPGKTVRCESVVSNVDGLKVEFNITVWEGDNIIGTASHSRFIVNNSKFMAKLQ